LLPGGIDVRQHGQRSIDASQIASRLVCPRGLGLLRDGRVLKCVDVLVLLRSDVAQTIRLANVWLRQAFAFRRVLSADGKFLQQTASARVQPSRCLGLSRKSGVWKSHSSQPRPPADK
jgi:hypothetical protein